MAIPRKQIGWSQESNLLWEIARTIEKINGQLGTSNPSGNSPTGNLNIPSKQIGGSQEYYLLYEVLKQLSRMRQII
jgi:hypothetical protein